MSEMERVVAKKRLHSLAALLAREENLQLRREVEQLADPAERIARYRAELQRLSALADGHQTLAVAEQHPATTDDVPSSQVDADPPSAVTDVPPDNGDEPEQAPVCEWAACSRPFISSNARRRFCSEACRQQAKRARAHATSADDADGSFMPGAIQKEEARYG